MTVLRLLWRWLNPVPAYPAELKPWERWAAHASHVGMYVLMFAVSLTGWVTANTMRTPITKDVFGISFPNVATVIDRSLRGLFEESHMLLAYVLAAVVAVHALAALRHHLSKRNDVLRRMTWGARTA